MLTRKQALLASSPALGLLLVYGFLAACERSDRLADTMIRLISRRT